jgi:penicillin-binding protein 1A
MRPPAGNSRSRTSRITRFVLKLGALAVVVGACGIFLLIKYIEFTSDIPLPSAKNGPVKASLILDHRGREIAKLGRDRKFASLKDMPKHLPQAALAAEDKHFYSHSGFSYPAIARAFLVNLDAGQTKQGGSTITQQYAKVAFLESGRTLERKYKEMILAGQIEKQMTKDQILEAYLNTIYLGNGAYGVASAAETLFGKPVGQLSLAESAYLGGAIRSPSTYVKPENADSALKRRNRVLDEMLKLEMITPKEHAEAAKAPLDIKQHTAQPHQHSGYPGVENLVREILEEKGFARIPGLKITTTIDLDMQKAAQAAFLVAIDPPSGAIRTWHPSTQEYDLHTQRAAGSTVKPFVVAAALANDIPLEQPLDAPACYQEGDKLCNYDRADHGKVDLIASTIKSLNTPFAQLLDKRSGLDKTVSPGKVKELALDAGLNDTLVQDDKSPVLEESIRLPLGAGGVTTLQLASAYTTLANGGKHNSPYLIAEIRTEDDKVLDRHKPEASQAIPERNAQTVNWLLSRALREGTGKNAFFGQPAAGKTGTSSNYTDARFTGYTTGLVASVWMGNVNNAPMNNITGGSVPAAIWKNFMARATQGMAANEFARPEAVEAQTTTTAEPATTTTTATVTTTTEPAVEVTVPEVVEELLTETTVTTTTAPPNQQSGSQAAQASATPSTTQAAPATTTPPTTSAPTTAPPTTLAQPPG